MLEQHMMVLRIFHLMMLELFCEGFGRYSMRKTVFVLLITLGLMFISVVRADGFSATLKTSLPNFSALLGLSYTLEPIPNLVVGGGISAFYGQPYPQLKFNLGVLYGSKVIDNTDGFLELYVGARVLGVVPFFAAWLEPNGGFSAELLVANKTKLFGNLDLIFDIPLTETGVFEFFGSLETGVKYALLENLEVGGSLFGSYRVVGDLFTQSNLGILAKGTYILIPQVKIGTSFGLTFSGTGEANFSITIFGSFIQNPGTLGTPDTRLP